MEPLQYLAHRAGDRYIEILPNGTRRPFGWAPVDLLRLDREAACVGLDGIHRDALAEFKRWLQARVDLHPAASSLPARLCHVAAIVAGLVSMTLLNWISPPLAIDGDAFNHRGSPEFAATRRQALFSRKQRLEADRELKLGD